MKKNRKSYEHDLNISYTPSQVLDMTEHCWAGSNKTKKQQNHAKKLANKGLYGTVLKKYDSIAFTVGFNEWVRN